ncbi:hypothetical protein VKS41_006413 [Umbelopsis sp. WA50703]
MIWQIVLLLGLVTYVECAPDVATFLDTHPTTIKLDFIGALAVAVSAISIESTLESYLSRKGRWRCALTGPGYLQTGLDVAVDVFKHITTLEISDAVNRPWKLVETFDPITYRLVDRTPQPIECGYLATVFARYTTHSSIISPWSDKRTEGTVCWLKDTDIRQPGRLPAPWYANFLWLGSLIVTAAPLAVAVWQLDWWMTAFGASLVLDAILRTAFAAVSDMTYNLELVQAKKKKAIAQYGDGVCIVTGEANVVEAACRSKIIGKSVPRSLALAYSFSSLIQVMGNLVAVPNGGAYAQLTYLGTLTVCFFLQMGCHRFRTRVDTYNHLEKDSDVNKNIHVVISSGLATRTEAVAYTAFLSLCQTRDYKDLKIISVPESKYWNWWKKLDDYIVDATRVRRGNPMETIQKDTDQYNGHYYADWEVETWQGKDESLERGVTRAQYHWSQRTPSFHINMQVARRSSCP